MQDIYILILGTLYGLVIGIIPGAGATTGLIAIFSFLSYFSDPYSVVIFCMAVVAASTTGDTYTGVLLGIPGANSAAATMVDGFPLAIQGKATYAISAAVVTSTVNGLLWGSLTFFLLPWYTQLIMVFGIPELWAFTMLAMATVAFVSNKYWFRSIIALTIGLYLGLVGINPETNVDRFTMGWDYLADGIQLIAITAGLFAFPEMLEGLIKKDKTAKVTDDSKQTWDGIKAVWQHKWLALRGGFIGAFIGVLPGLGGGMADWMAYGQAVATTKNPDVPFGKGNIRGVIGPEGANNAQKATSMIPTVLFGIPGASFAAILMAIFATINFDLGSYAISQDQKFFDSMSYGFMWATLLTGIICMFTTKYIAKIAAVPYKYYFPILLAFIVWACVQYTGGWEDYAILLIFGTLGVIMKKFKFSRPALLIGFILASRVEGLSLQLFSIYTIEKLSTRPIFLGLIAITIALLVWGITRKSEMEFS
jgi:putative tricarboxylic transport membrane protein